MTKHKTAGLLMGLLMVWAGCGEAEKESTEEPRCGQGSVVNQDGMEYCVYASKLVIENGFNCPPSLHNYGAFGPVGVCGPAGQEGTIPKVHKAHRQDNPAMWDGAQCVEDVECTGQGERCEDATCQTPVCPDRHEPLGDTEMCRADNAQWTCATAGEVTCKRTACPDGFVSEAGVNLLCTQSAQCYRLLSGTWCTAICPDQYEALPAGTDCQGNSRASCLIEGQTVCARVACGQGYELRDPAAGDTIPASCQAPDCLALHSGKFCLKTP